jgi:hypothetical protein
MGQMVIVAYKPKSGHESGLRDCIREHLAVLRREGLATDRPPLVMRAEDGTLLEIFEWASAEAVEKAHTNPAVLALWGRFEEVCTYEKLGDLPESQRPFSPFLPVDDL